MSELFLKIINMSISASWLILAVLILRLVLKKAPKWVNVLLWGIVAVRLICPFSFESALSLIPSAETFPEKVISGPSFDIQTGISPVDNRINDYLGDRYFEGVTVPANNGNNIMTILTIVWIIGILLLVAYTIISYRRLHREIDTAVHYKDNIFQSEIVKSPFVLGIIKPRIYLPFNINGQEFKMNIKGREEVDLEWGGKLVFINSVVGGAIDARFMPAILKGIMDCMEHGPLTGSYARDVRVIVYDGKMHPVDSNELSFMLAARHAFSDAFKQAGPKILEPIYDLEVYVPADYMGDVMSDLQGRRAMIMGMDSEAGYQKLQAKIPLKELSNYSIALSSLTGGRASFSTKFASYELVPNDIQQKLIAEHEAEQKDED